MDQVHRTPSALYWHSEAYSPKDLSDLVHLSNTKVYSAEYPFIILNWDKAFKGKFAEKLPFFTKAHVIRFTQEGIITKFHSDEPDFSQWRDKATEDNAPEPFHLLNEEPCPVLDTVQPLKLPESTIENLKKAKVFVPFDKQLFINTIIESKTGLEDEYSKSYSIIPSTPGPSATITEIDPEKKEWKIDKILQHRLGDDGYYFKAQYETGSPWWAPARDFYDVLPDKLQYEEQFKKYLDEHGISLLQVVNTDNKHSTTLASHLDTKEEKGSKNKNRKRKRDSKATNNNQNKAKNKKKKNIM